MSNMASLVCRLISGPAGSTRAGGFCCGGGVSGLCPAGDFAFTGVWARQKPPIRKEMATRGTEKRLSGRKNRIENENENRLKNTREKRMTDNQGEPTKVYASTRAGVKRSMN